MKVFHKNKNDTFYTKRTKKTAVATVGLLLAFFLSACHAAQPTKMITQTGFYFDTVITVQAYASEEDLIAAFDKCREYEEMLSRTVEGSDVWKINHADGESVSVSKETMEVLLFAQKMAEDTNGAFDITIAPVADLWDFNGENPSVPSEKEITEAVSKVGYKQLRLDENDLTATMAAGASIDLGGIAKGFIADKVGEFLVERGVQMGILNFGGNVVLLGSKPDGTPWKVGVQDPKKFTGEFLGVVECVGAGSVVTSGTYERFFMSDGIRYHHILDPQTGYPVQNHLAGVSIVTDSSMVADAYSTACFVLGPVDGKKYAEQNPDVEALFIDDEGNAVMTEGMQGMYSVK